MRINLIARHLSDRRAGQRTDLVALVERRAAAALGRFAEVIRRIDIRIDDVNGPKGGADLDCLARVHLAPGGQLVVEGRAGSPEAGITQVLARVTAALRRHLDRQRSR